MSMFERPSITPLGATALLARLGEEIDRDLTLRLTGLVRHLDHLALPGLVDLVPAYTTLLAIIDPERLDHDTLARHISEGWKVAADNLNAHNPDTRTIEISVVYGGDAGPDLEDVAAHTGLAPEEVVRRHSEADYTVGALGFAPGFAFLIGLPPELATPRRSSPRTRVPSGSVGIAGGQTGVYSLPTPGGWSLIGRTPRRMFDPDAEPNDELRPGDAIRFVPIAAEDAPPFFNPTDATHPDTPSDGAIQIVTPGVQTSVQDLGRAGQGRIGITPGGALDRGALIAGNRLLGNPESAAAIEWTLLPPVIRFHRACRIVLTGADPGWRRNDHPVTIGEVLDAASGDLLRAQPSGEILGARGYVCVSGGIDVSEVRGSRALDLSAGFGGGYGRPLRPGDLLNTRASTDSPNPDDENIFGRMSDPAGRPFRVVRGAQADRFGDNAWRTFLSEPFTIDAQSNRMGLRLNGPAIEPDGGADVISEGVVTGAIQVTGSGQPIVLLSGRATIGGYTKIATVIEADHDRLGQLPPGASIRFAEVSLDVAAAALREWRPSVYGGLSADEEELMMTHEHDIPDTADDWTPDGVIRVLRELASQDVRAFSLRVESAGLDIAIDRGGGMPVSLGQTATPSRTEQPDSEQQEHDVETPPSSITAPLLGTFYRRPSPGEPPFVEEGAQVEAGQTVGLIEVMKTFNDVTAPEAGIVGRVLVEDGATVEFGQSLVEFEPLASPEDE